MKKKHRTEEQKEAMKERKAEAKHRVGNFYEEKLTKVHDKVYSQYVPVKPKPEAEGINVMQMIKAELYTRVSKMLNVFRG
jgi:fibrillarin-like rRNA methylase